MLTLLRYSIKASPASASATPSDARCTNLLSRLLSPPQTSSLNRWPHQTTATTANGIAGRTQNQPCLSPSQPRNLSSALDRLLCPPATPRASHIEEARHVGQLKTPGGNRLPATKPPLLPPCTSRLSIPRLPSAPSAAPHLPCFCHLPSPDSSVEGRLSRGDPEEFVNNSQSCSDDDGCSGAGWRDNGRGSGPLQLGPGPATRPWDCREADGGSGQGLCAEHPRANPPEQGEEVTNAVSPHGLKAQRDFISRLNCVAIAPAGTSARGAARSSHLHRGTGLESALQRALHSQKAAAQRQAASGYAMTVKATVVGEAEVEGHLVKCYAALDEAAELGAANIAQAGQEVRRANAQGS